MSPIVYLEKSAIRAQALVLLSTMYVTEKGIYHYRSMAKKNYRGYLREAIVPLKKYFYVLRPLLAARWVVQTESGAPIEFEKLLVLLQEEPEVLAAVHQLLELKRNTPELGLSPAVPILNRFIEAELGSEPKISAQRRDPNRLIDPINDLFHSVLQEWDVVPSK